MIIKGMRCPDGAYERESEDGRYAYDIVVGPGGAEPEVKTKTT